MRRLPEQNIVGVYQYINSTDPSFVLKQLAIANATASNITEPTKEELDAIAQ